MLPGEYMSLCAGVLHAPVDGRCSVTARAVTSEAPLTFVLPVSCDSLETGWEARSPHFTDGQLEA